MVVPPQRELVVDDDGLPTPEVGSWAEDKYRLLWTYAELFSTSMKGKWDQRVYVDLFSGAGRSRIRGTSRVVLASPLLALEVKHPFDRYIFCEKDPELLHTLRTRSSPYRRIVDFVSGDVNDEVGSILAAMPAYSSESRVLTFCFVDPCALENLRFSTIETLASRYIDFLVLVPSGMDAQRNEGMLLRRDNRVLDDFLGGAGWREEWEAQRTRFSGSFETFVTWHSASR
jgi:three-Cys-motif partner protein